MALVTSGTQEKQIEILKRGTCFGVISILTGDSHSVTARSMEASLVAQVSRDAFKRFLEANPSIALDFSRILSQRVTSRFKPKRIFQSKKIGILKNAVTERLDYIGDLAKATLEEAKKNIICVLLLPAPSAAGEKKVLQLKDFREEEIGDYVLKGPFDRMYITIESANAFFSLVNFLSESYHFIFYEIHPIQHSSLLRELLQPAQQIHFLVSGLKRELKDAAALLKELYPQGYPDREKVRLIVAQGRHGGMSLEDIRALSNCSVYAVLPDTAGQDYANVLRKISRHVAEMMVGLALGSGGAYGFAHIGVLKVLEEENISIDIISGSSTGAMIAACWAAGFDMNQTESFAREFARKISFFSLSGYAIPFRGILKARRLESIFKRFFKNLQFCDLKRTLRVVAFDFLKRRTVVLHEGPVYKAVAASCAFPGIFEPVRFQKDIFLDGGILAPLPTEILLQDDAYKIIASNIALTGEQAQREYGKRSRLHIFDFVFGSIETIQQQFITQALRIADVVIHPDLEGLSWMEFDRVSEFIQRGQDAARIKIGDIKKLVAG
jgi:NTE family protein